VRRGRRSPEVGHAKYVLWSDHTVEKSELINLHRGISDWWKSHVCVARWDVRRVINKTDNEIIDKLALNTSDSLMEYQKVGFRQCGRRRSYFPPSCSRGKHKRSNLSRFKKKRRFCFSHFICGIVLPFCRL